MSPETIVRDLKAKFPGDLVTIVEKSPKRVYIEIKADSLRKWALYLHKDLGARFNIASGVDVRTEMEILYHFTLEDINLVISLRVRLAKPNPAIDSLAPLFPAANWIEREIHELLGVQFKGHPDMR